MNLRYRRNGYRFLWGLLCWSSLWTSSLGWASLEFDLRHEIRRSIPDNIQQSFIYSQTPTWGGFRLGGRLVQEAAVVDRASYFGEVQYAPFSFLDFSIRLQQAVRIADQAGSTSGAALVGLCVPGTTVQFCARLGGLRRWWQIEKRAWFPGLYQSAIAEWDFIVRFDLHVNWTDRWNSTLSLGTFENIDIYNVNNPYLELHLLRKGVWEGIDIFGFVRYQVVLGFAIFENWTSGVGFRAASW